MQPDLEPPSAILDELPCSAYILSSLDIILPTKSPSMDSNTLDKATWFLMIWPNTNLNVTQTLVLPPDGMLYYLVAQLRAAGKEGCHSLRGPSDPAKNHLPLWVIQYWQTALDVIINVAQWRNSIIWLNGISTRMSNKNFDEAWLCLAIQEAKTCLSLMQMNAQIYNEVMDVHVDVWELSQLLLNGWISSDVMNLMLACLAERVLASADKANLVFIGHFIISKGIVDIFGLIGLKKHLIHESIENHIYSGLLKKLYLIYNILNSHWIAVELDIDAWCIWIGDSLEMRDITPELVPALNNWLSKLLGGQLQTTYDLPHGVQNDSYSCSICSVNVIKYSIWPSSTTLWKPVLHFVLHLEKFCEIS